MKTRLHATLAAALLLGTAMPAGAAEDASLADVRAAIARQDHAGAQRLLEQRLAAAPEDREATFLLARVLAWQGQPERALALYQALLADAPDNADYLFGQGQAQLWSGRRAAAQATLERARALAPANPEIAAALAQARATTGHDGTRALASAPSANADTADAAAMRNRGIGLSARREWLSGGRDDWQAYRLDVADVPRDARGWYGALNHERRFGRSDNSLELGALLPLGSGWTLQPEAGVAPGADFLARWYADLRLQRVLQQGWVLAGSMRHTAYRDLDVDRLALGAERYVGNWRVGYTLNLADAGGERLVGHAGALDRYYGDRNVAGVRVSVGEDTGLEGTTVITGNVASIALQGRHWVNPAWAVTWSTGWLDQDDAYESTWVQLGIWRGF
jgi:YaiO family outer membrane protein